MGKSFKEKLAANEPVIVVNTDHASASLTEAVARNAVDAILVDCEHGFASTERVQDMCRAAVVANVHSIVRPETFTKFYLNRYLDAGARGVMVPHVDTAERAREIVETVRGVWYRDFSDMVITLMIESRQAVDNLDAILEVNDVDVLFIGPDDLSQSMGYAGRSDHDDVQAVIGAAIDKIRSAGRHVGTAVNSRNVAKFRALGCQYLYTHVDSFIGVGIEDFRQRLA
ncbi:aldolase/citrate lyase family protein [Shinella sp. S4-D37]|uniref:HpcH/HpaI aldolase family protein n=1 Tax=Shinella sp. S4-D37 TaxID=3161999 RepID=UPI0034661DCD